MYTSSTENEGQIIYQPPELLIYGRIVNDTSVRYQKRANEVKQ